MSVRRIKIKQIVTVSLTTKAPTFSETQILWHLAEGKRKHADIAREIGVSQEYVRQVAKTLGVSAEESAIAAMRNMPNGRQKLFRPFRFTFLIRQCLDQIGCGYCCNCHAALPLEQMTKSVKQRPGKCKRCTANAVNRYSKTKAGKAKAYEWRQSDRGKACMRANTERWLAKQRQAGTEKARTA